MKFFLKLRTKRVIFVCVCISIFVRAAYSEDKFGNFPAVFNLADLNGTNGFTINGINPDDRSGGFLKGAGDVNGDGFNDIIIAAFRIRSFDQSYVIFGSNKSWPTSINLADLDGNNGFAISGTQESSFPTVSGVGDINGDGIDDFSTGGYIRSSVIFGSKKPWPARMDLRTLNGTNGFQIDGIFRSNGWFFVSGAGDVNGDGIDDILIGDKLFNNRAGQSYVVFGSKEPWSTVINISSLNGGNGFALDGIHPDDYSGSSVSDAGDVNGDGIDDFLIDADRANNFAGQSYVIFGRKEPWPAVMDLSSLNGVDGFAINGIPVEPNFTEGVKTVSGAGDVNGDGIDDIIIGALRVNDFTGQSYVIFGSKKVWPPSINLADLDGNNGFTMNGPVSSRSGWSVSGAGDVNGDGIDDILIGAPSVNDGIGQSYVVFGSKELWPAVIELADLNGNNGFTMNGRAVGGSGATLSGVGDMNGDGIDDILIGAPSIGNRVGQSYVVFGSYGHESPPSSSDTPLILGLSIGIGGGIVLMGIGGYCGYQHCYHGDYEQVQ